MATNMFKKYTEALTREIAVPTGTAPGTPLLEAVSNRPAVTLTGSGDYTLSHTNADGSVTSGIPTYSGTAPLGAVAAFDGTWLLAVTGVTAGPTGSAGAGTDKGTAVYITSGGVLNLTSSGNTLFGRVDDGFIVGTTTPVQIGVN